MTCTEVLERDVDVDTERQVKRRRTARDYPCNEVGCGIPPRYLCFATRFPTALPGSKPTTPDLIIRVDSTSFRVHKDRLLCSDVFRDMFSLPQPSGTNIVDGCTVVELAGDSLTDWEATLTWIYDTRQTTAGALGWSQLKGALRIATKYMIQSLRECVIQRLQMLWPEYIFDMDLNSLPNAAEAISLARECDVPSILPSAFYALSVQRWATDADGGCSHLVLTPTDMRRLIVGREAIQIFIAEILVDPLREHQDEDEQNDASDVVCSSCRSQIAQYWRQRLAPDPETPWTFWLSREMKFMTLDLSFCNSLCEPCSMHHEALVFLRIQRLNNSISGFFSL
ncbi:hypothetical protein FISHEDRAFT_40887 [Fistulina hepatica ATCC 64428]|uniref:BTB domain-containing protein n=1 Tax=Fistulina hepatica ATCC 64428 TaxID=1128425 RepID=A0A0D7AH75_9AGAR|nr:hypothetical protein FISHEDRAFT_40887 [Fistulina hepatica ATCC 64428]